MILEYLISLNKNDNIKETKQKRSVNEYEYSREIAIMMIKERRRKDLMLTRHHYQS